jgi:LacI family transcriptional regulator
MREIRREPRDTLDTGRSSARLMSAVRRDLAAGTVLPGDFLPPVRALGAQHGLAVATVCKGLRQLAQEGLIRAVPRRGYRILPHADSPAGSLACVISEEHMTTGLDPFYAAVETAVRRAARRRGWQTTAWVTIAQGQENALKGQLQTIGAWGMFLDSNNPTVLAIARQAAIPVVLVDAWTHDAPFDAVVQDNFGGAALATQHLLNRGHRSFGWFGPIGETNHSRERFGGAAATLAAAGRSFAGLAEVDPNRSDLAAQAAAFLAKLKRPTAILALWPSTAMAISAAARAARLVAGRDFELVGWCAEEIYDNTFLPAMGGMQPAATVVWSATAMAEAAVDRLAEPRNHPARTPLRLNIATRLRLPNATVAHR